MAAQVLALALALSTLLAQAVPTTAGQGWQKGFTLWGRPANYASALSLQAMQQLKTTGANSVGLVVAWYVLDGKTAALRPGWNTPNDQDLVAAIEQAHGLGLDIVLHLHVDALDGSWRGNLDPPDKQGLFAAYDYFVHRYAKLAQANGVRGLVIGSELVKLTGPKYTQRWLQIIADARKNFNGFITYGAEWGGAAPEVKDDPLREYAQVQFWPALDYIGIAAYFELAPSPGDRPTMPQLLARWAAWRKLRLDPLQAKYDKPLLFTEVGYRSTQGAAARPWDSTLADGIDLQGQADLYGALLQTWAGVPWFKGVYFWFWSTEPNQGGLLDQDYPPQNKPALQQIVRAFGGVLPQPIAPLAGSQN